jgi:Raf kinase inhibitor-like YbhB/YbcL family protein
MTFSISSSAFGNGQPIPRKYTCEGENVSPDLSWSGIPAETSSLALIVEDPDAPLGIWIHWVLYNISPSLMNLNENIPAQKTVSRIGTHGRNSFKKIGYGGPCPPPGKRHRYYFRLYALNLPLDLPEEITADQLRNKISGHIIAQAEWMGTYIR